MYNVRSNAGSAQQAQRGGLKYYAQPAQPSNPHLESHIGQGQGGLARQQVQGVGAPGPTQGMHSMKYEDSGPQGEALWLVEYRSWQGGGGGMGCWGGRINQRWKFRRSALEWKGEISLE